MGTRTVIYSFGEFTLDPRHRTLLRYGQPIPITPKCFDTLAFLLKNKGQVIEKQQLLEALWPDSFVEEANLKQNIYVLRRLLGDDSNGHSFIVTLPRRGYKFIGSVTEAEIAEPAENGNGASTSSAIIQYWTQHSPFRGLQVFEPEDAWLFFGRESETGALVERLGRSSVLVVAGNSGSGKSSLVRAGLIPALRYGGSSESWRTVLFRPSANPCDYLAEALPAQLRPSWSPQQHADFAADCRSSFTTKPGALGAAITALANMEKHDESFNGNGARAGENPHRVLLVVDQFEEVFTLVDSQPVRDRYIDMLLATCRFDSSVAISLLLVLRADFYSRCLEHSGLSSCLESNLFNVPRLAGEKLRENIEKRLELAGAYAEAGLIDRLLEDVGSEPGNLALLEHALDQLWAICGGFGHTLTNQAYAAIGGLRGALGNHADHVYESLDDPELKNLAQHIFLALVHLGEDPDVQDTRQRVRKAELLSLGAPEVVDRLLACLASARLISTGRESEETFVEVSHEALIREWPRLREWLTENRDRLRLERRLHQAANEWEALQHDPGALLQGARLAQAEEWVGGQTNPSPLLHTFIQSSVNARAERARKDQESLQRAATLDRHSAVRLRWFSSALAVLLLMALGATWFARKQGVLADARTLAAQSEQMLTHDQGRALDLALRGWDTAKTPETYIAVTKAAPQTLSVLRHDAEIVAATFSPDGKRIVTGSWDHTGRLWNASDGSLIAVLRGHSDKIEEAVFSPDSQRLVTASSDHTARVWNAADGRLLALLAGHTDALAHAAFSPDSGQVVTASADHTAKVWNAVNGRMLMTLSGHTLQVYDARFSPDGQYIATTSLDGTAAIWRSSDGHLLTVLRGHVSYVYSIGFSFDRRRIVTASADHTARVWSVADGRLLNILHHDNMVATAAFSADARRILTTSLDNTARLWSASDGHLLAILRHDGPLSEGEFSPDNRLIVTAGWDNTARVWNAADGRLLAILQGHTGPVWTARFSPDGGRIVTGSSDHTARIWNLGSARLLTTLNGEGLVLSGNGRLIAATSPDHVVRIFNTTSGRLIAELTGHSDRVCSAMFSPDGRRVLTASLDHTARVWSSSDGRLLATLEGHSDKVCQAIFSPDGRLIATASSDHTARIWNSSDGRQLAILNGHTARVRQAVFSPDGQRIVTPSEDHTIRIWKTSDGQLLTVLQGHTDAVSQAEFSPDGQRIVTASADHTARVWSASDGHLLVVLQGHTDRVNEARFSPDGQRIVTASADRTARVWRTSDGHLLATLEGHTGEIWSATFSPDGRQIATASGDDTARIWSAADGRLIATLQGRQSYPMFRAMYSFDGKRVITAGPDDTVRIWQVVTLADIQALDGK